MPHVDIYCIYRQVSYNLATGIKNVKTYADVCVYVCVSTCVCAHVCAM